MLHILMRKSKYSHEHVCMWAFHSLMKQKWWKLFFNQKDMKNVKTMKNTVYINLNIALELKQDFLNDIMWDCF